MVSHPEGRAFVDQLRATSDLFIESLPAQEEFEAHLEPLGLEVTAYRDEPRLYLWWRKRGDACFRDAAHYRARAHRRLAQARCRKTLVDIARR